MDIFLKSPRLNKQSNAVVYVKCLDLAAVEWVGFLSQPSPFSQEQSYLSVELDFQSLRQGPGKAGSMRKHGNYLKAKCPGLESNPLIWLPALTLLIFFLSNQKSKYYTCMAYLLGTIEGPRCKHRKPGEMDW